MTKTPTPSGQRHLKTRPTTFPVKTNTDHKFWPPTQPKKLKARNVTPETAIRLFSSHVTKVKLNSRAPTPTCALHTESMYNDPNPNGEIYGLKTFCNHDNHTTSKKTDASFHVTGPGCRPGHPDGIQNKKSRWRNRAAHLDT